MQLSEDNYRDTSGSHSDTRLNRSREQPLGSVCKKWQRPTKNSPARSDLAGTSYLDHDLFLTCPTTTLASGATMGFVLLKNFYARTTESLSIENQVLFDQQYLNQNALVVFALKKRIWISMYAAQYKNIFNYS